MFSRHFKTFRTNSGQLVCAFYFLLLLTLCDSQGGLNSLRSGGDEGGAGVGGRAGALTGVLRNALRFLRLNPNRNQNENQDERESPRLSLGRLAGILRRGRVFEPMSLRPETFMSTPELVRFHGYKVEEHKVTTEDGYIIKIFRIPSANQTKAPALLTHGILCSSDDYLLIPDPKEILPFLLANDGHNVWLGNIRGNSYGMEHSRGISPFNSKFYDFSMDELGRDVSAIIRYILTVESAPQLDYVCHSMGCNMISIAVNEDGEMNKLVRKASFMSPSPYVTHLRSPLIRAISFIPHPMLRDFSERFAGGRFVPSELLIAFKRLTPRMCGGESRFRNICARALALTFGRNPNQLVNVTMSTIFAHTPNETSMKLFIHYLQSIREGNFQKFDYGTETNLVKYASPTPPIYNLTQVTFPVQGMYGMNDFLVGPEDVLRSLGELGNLVTEPIRLSDERWSHIDFIYGKDAKKLVYDPIVEFLGS